MEFSQQHFIEIINLILEIESREDPFNKALQEFTHDKDFTGFYSDISSRLVKYLEEITHDKDETIAWWLWDGPNKGQAKDRFCTITLDNKKWLLKTPADLFTYLKEMYV